MQGAAGMLRAAFRRIAMTCGALLAACLVPAEAPAAPAAWWAPAMEDRLDIQFVDRPRPKRWATVIDVDAFDVTDRALERLKRRGKRVVCYINAGAWEAWRADADRYPAVVLGHPLAGWEDERWVDIRRLDVLGPILEARLDHCRARGFDAVEFDNVDGWTNDTGFPLTAADQLRFNRWLAAQAHARGLGVALKNDLEQAADLVADFDFAIVESCFSYDECHLVRPFLDAGKPVFVVEYVTARRLRRRYCRQAADLGVHLIFKKLSLGRRTRLCR